MSRRSEAAEWLEIPAPPEPLAYRGPTVKVSSRAIASATALGEHLEWAVARGMRAAIVRAQSDSEWIDTP